MCLEYRKDMEILRVPLPAEKTTPMSEMMQDSSRSINGARTCAGLSHFGRPSQIMRLTSLLCFASILKYSSSTAWPLFQESSAVADTLAKQADSLVAAREFGAAKDLYQQILDRNDSSAVALKGMGKISFAEKSWSSAVSWFEKASESVPNDLEARYYLGCAHGERGRELYVLEMIAAELGASTNFKKAAEDFRWVIGRDSFYRDTFIS